MFDTMNVARQIRNARIAKNMTQMNLADAMEVSYQAVSNWERGNSMPDIAKIQPLCDILDISAEQLLGMGKETDAVKKLIGEDGTEKDKVLTLQEAEDILPILSPQESREIVEESIRRQEKTDINHIISLAPFLGRDTLGQLVEHNLPEQISIDTLFSLAPFLHRDTLSRLAEALPKEDMSMHNLISLAPFLHRDTLSRLAEALPKEDMSMHNLISLAPFLHRDALSRFAEALPKEDMSMHNLISLAPFLHRDTLSRFAEALPPQEMTMKNLLSLAPFLRGDALGRLAEALPPQEMTMKNLISLAPFLRKDTLDRLTFGCMARGDAGDEGRAPLSEGRTEMIREKYQ